MGEQNETLTRHKYHIALAIIVSVVTLIINVLAFASKNASDYLYLFDLVYVAANSAHLVTLSIFPNGINLVAKP